MAVDMTDKAHALGVPRTDGQGVSAGMEHKGRAAQGRARAVGRWRWGASWKK